MVKFNEFIYNNFTITVLISVISFRLYVSLLDNVINPIILNIIDKNLTVTTYKFKFKGITLNIGEFIRDLFSTLIIILIIYMLYVRVR